ncbi:hypothetical protein [Mycolicibacterium sp. XJ870]
MAERPVAPGAVDPAATSTETIAALLDSPSMRILQPAMHGGRSGTVEDFLAAVGALAKRDGPAGWLAAAVNVAAHEVGGAPAGTAGRIWGRTPDALVVGSHTGGGLLTGSGSTRKLTGHWPSVLAARHADWLVLPADDSAGGGYRVLVPRSAADITPVSGPAALQRTGAADVEVIGVAVESPCILESHSAASISAQVLLSAGLAAAVAGSADGAWHAHIAEMKERLATSYGGEEVADQTPSTVRVARTASEIDAAVLQITEAAHHAEDLAAAVRAHRQAVARARDAADTLLASSRRHALNAADPVTRLWGDVHSGARLAVALFDRLDGR